MTTEDLQNLHIKKRDSKRAAANDLDEDFDHSLRNNTRTRKRRNGYR